MVVTPKQLDRFTVPGDTRSPPPVYLIKPASLFDRAHYRGDLDAAGLRLPGEDELLNEARAAAAELGGGDASMFQALIDQAQAGEIEPNSAAAKQWQRFAQSLLDHWPPYRELIAARSKWMTLAPLYAARRFLRGWENVDAEFRLGADGLVPEAVLEALPDEDISMIGLRAIALLRPDGGEEKNSASPPMSARARPASPAGAAASAAKASSSRARSSKKTRA